ncbi:hypothetical protein MPTK1_1g17030 [Marchantia polymorpha subsp. ruderalis]|uniref:LHC-related protein n=2 Tax=Marchantia polymorpha TaxID=3197 RepID=A0AAF6AR29_MARPO|nr:hypothetical protein MARPO_0001s0043 [Marchantia polymorpha]BBM98899.1 hypothetical protein Mp_1g17030 [Marchantia polymorpha subsp. ruderalis]|eukprot:PTQ49975.1 hypothetical protein MARPO_0001s0043 [Marchantia polymorpha]
MAAMAPSVIQSAVAAAVSLPVTFGAAQSTTPCFQSYSFSKGFLPTSKLVLKSQASSRQSRLSSRLNVRASEEGSASGAAGDSVVAEVALLEEEPPTPGVGGGAAVATKPNRKPGALQRGGTLGGKDALGKDPSLATLGVKTALVDGGKFDDPRWIGGNWDLKQFTKDGKVHWDGVIDAEVKRRRWLEDNPEASSNDEPVLFETSTVPWWAWVKRFHLPEAELLNGRAAMIGYVAGYFVDSLTGAGLVDQQNSFFGKLLLFITIGGVLLIRKNEDLDTLKNLAKESTFYDKQWQATWKEDTTKDDKTQV